MKFDQEEMRRLAGRYFAGEIAAEEERELFRFVTSDAACPVSYTHLTLPTKLEV